MGLEHPGFSWLYLLFTIFNVLVFLLDFGLPVVGVILATRKARQGNRRYIYVAWFFVLWLVTEIIRPLIDAHLPALLVKDYHLPVARLGMVMSLLGSILILIRAGALCLLLIGLFKGVRTYNDV